MKCFQWEGRHQINQFKKYEHKTKTVIQSVLDIYFSNRTRMSLDKEHVIL